MTIAHILAGLTPRSSQIDGLPRGGISAWSMADRVALLKGIKGPALSWAYYRYCGQDARAIDVIRWLGMSIDLYCGINKYRLARETRAGIIEAAFTERTQQACPRCRGEGNAWNPDQFGAMTWGPCKRCRGGGTNRLSMTEIANITGIARASWGASHDAVFNEVLRLMADIDQEVARIVWENYKAATGEK